MFPLISIPFPCNAFELVRYNTVYIQVSLTSKIPFKLVSPEGFKRLLPIKGSETTRLETAA